LEDNGGRGGRLGGGSEADRDLVRGGGLQSLTGIAGHPQQVRHAVEVCLAGLARPEHLADGGGGGHGGGGGGPRAEVHSEELQLLDVCLQDGLVVVEGVVVAAGGGGGGGEGGGGQGVGRVPHVG